MTDAQTFTVRAARAEDFEEIVTCWTRSFGDPRELVTDMIESGGLMEHAVVAVSEGRVCGVSFCFDGLRFGPLTASYRYAVCTLPEYRGIGIGTALCRETTEQSFARSADMILTVPGDQGLERWYREAFGMGLLLRCAAVPVEVSGGPGPDCVPITCEEYAALRAGHGGVDVPLSMLSAQDAIFRHGGGGFFRAGNALVCAGADAGGVLVRELLYAPAERDAALIAVSRRFGGAPLRLWQAAPEGQALLYQLRPGLKTAEGAVFPLPFPLD